MELIINFSGGKDSCAMLAYLCEEWPDVPKRAVFADTGWEHVGALDWCRGIVARYGLELYDVRNPNKTFLSMVAQRGKFPSAGQRQCTSDLKRGPIETWIRRNLQHHLVINCLGLRGEESTDRANKDPVTLNEALTNIEHRDPLRRRIVWNWLPIHSWTKQQVLDTLTRHGIPLHPVYQHLDRFSCRVCIFMSHANLRAVHQHDPEAFNIIADLEKQIGFTMRADGPIENSLSPQLPLF